ncbi:unannotated protein [freshwater metagenome]|uniref:Unannotated protein n=1 Tax=freshwater metagenome TaxID=449393 RepID=A0A6J7ASD3_9ZZZZ
MPANTACTCSNRSRGRSAASTIASAVGTSPTTRSRCSRTFFAHWSTLNRSISATERPATSDEVRARRPPMCNSGFHTSETPELSRGADRSELRLYDAVLTISCSRLRYSRSMRFGGPVVPLVSICTATPGAMVGASPRSPAATTIAKGTSLSSARSASEPASRAASRIDSLAQSLAVATITGRRSRRISSASLSAGMAELSVTRQRPVANAPVIARTISGRFRISTPTIEPSPKPAASSRSCSARTPAPSQPHVRQVSSKCSAFAAGSSSITCVSQLGR